MAKYVESDLDQSASVREDQAALTGKYTFWKPEDPGVYYYRTLPAVESMVSPHTGKAAFFWGVPLHFGIAPGRKTTVFCPRRASKGELPCAICDIWLPYVKRDSTATAEEKEVAKNYLPNWRNYMNILLLDPKTGEPVREEDGSIKVRVFGPGTDIIDKTIAALEDLAEDLGEDRPNIKNLVDPKIGRVVRLKRTGKGKFDTDYDVKLKKVLDVTPYTEWWEDNLAELPAINPPSTPEQIQALVAGVSTTPVPDAFEKKAVAAPKAEAPDAFDEAGGPASQATVEAEFRVVVVEESGSTNAFGDDDTSPVAEPAAKGGGAGPTSRAANDKLRALLDGE